MRVLLHLTLVPVTLTVLHMATKITNLSKTMDKKKLESFKKRLEERQQSLRKMVR